MGNTTPFPRSFSTSSWPEGVAVALVGAGPGAADLITLRGWRRLQAADVVVHDDLLTPELLEAAGGAELIYVGKRAGRVHTPQAEICATLVEQASLGRKVVRLKGGDPMLFGRATEEIRALREAGLVFEVVPGVTAAAAAGAAEGFSLTQRHVASAVVFATGHECEGKQGPAVRWAEFARMGATLCIYMGSTNGPRIARDLISGGLASSTPVVAAAAVSHADQRFRAGTLATLAEGILLHAVGTPVVLIVGEVAQEAGVVRDLVQAACAA
jgi:uroporphyrin-III C-methyltransferase